MSGLWTLTVSLTGSGVLCLNATHCKSSLCVLRSDPNRNLLTSHVAGFPAVPPSGKKKSSFFFQVKSTRSLELANFHSLSRHPASPLAPTCWKITLYVYALYYFPPEFNLLVGTPHV